MFETFDKFQLFLLHSFTFWIFLVTLLDLVDFWVMLGVNYFIFQICAMDAVADMEEDLKVVMKADPDKQESLQTEVNLDPMEGEQTWPTEEELSEANGWYWQTCL